MAGYVLTGFCKLVTFTLDAPGFPAIVWNITQIEHDAFRGRFGPPEEQAFSELASWENREDEWRHADKSKVLRFIRLAYVPAAKPDWSTQGTTWVDYQLIDIPSIAAIIPGPDDRHYAFPIDGNHRMLARQQLNYKTFPRFVVPPELEGEYRIQLQELRT
jgi:hypothetical protein